MTPKRLFCFGFGYVAARLAASLQDWQIAATATTTEKCAALKQSGIDAFLFDDVPDFDGVTHLLLSIPPDSDGDPAFRRYGDAIAKINTLQWAGYLSATSVYGDHNGHWIDETTPAIPNSPRGIQRLQAEQQWSSLKNFPLHIFRLAGIYGPGRSAIDTVRTGKAQRIEKPGHFFNRIHVDDIVRVMTASMQRPDSGAIYNLADDLPATGADVIAHACKLLGQDPPPLIPFAAAEMTPMARRFYAENKRLRNTKIKKDLGLELLYPDYKTGLDACHKQ